MPCPYCEGPFHWHHHHSHHHHWNYPPEPAPEPYYSPRSRDDFVHRIEDEREMLERRLRRLEQELAELRQPSAPSERSQ